MKRDTVTNYLGDIKATYELIERIKSYYYHRGVALNGVSFWVEPQLDQWGSKLYAVRSNIKFDVAKGTMRFGDMPKESRLD